MLDESEESFPDIDDRFLPPHKWRWHYFKTPTGRKLRFGTAAPVNKVPKAVVIVLQGRTEFIEKYFELANDLIDNNMSFWMMDWYGQGLSERSLPNPHKHHSNGFHHDVEDLHYFIMQYVKYASVHPDIGKLPMVMLSHSMGGTIGLQYLLKYPEIFDAAAFCAPMIKIKALPRMPSALLKTVSVSLRALSPRSYAPGKQKDWCPSLREQCDPEIFSEDDVRKKIHNEWCNHDPNLQLGQITNGWLYHALKACKFVQNPKNLAPIKTPCLFGLAGHDMIIDNAAVKNAVSKIDNKKIVTFDEAQHEIFMERDEIRDQFLKELFDFVDEYKISPTQKKQLSES